MSKYSKYELLKILAMRDNIVEIDGKIASKTNIKKMSVSQLKETLGEISSEEEFKILSMREKCEKYTSFTVDELSTKAKLLGLQSSGLKQELIERIIDAEEAGVVEIILDKDQQIVMDDIDKYSNIIVHAGPGCGKSVLMSHICRLYHLDGKTILILSFTNLAIKTIISYLKKYSISYKNEEINIMKLTGLNIMTIDKFARDLNFKTDDEKIDGEDTEDYIENQNKFLKMAPLEIKYNNIKVDLLMIDEMQDFDDKYFPLVTSIIATKTIFLGDPRQRIFTGTNMTNKFIEMKPTHLLRYNHRSTPTLVNFMNEMSKELFKEYHFDQFPIKDNIQESNIYIATMKDLPEIMIKNISATIITPYTLEKYDIGDKLRDVATTVCNYNCGQHIYILNSKDYYEENKNSIICTTVRGIKGSQTDTCILLFFDIEYPGITDKRSIDFLFFTALGRAKKNIYFITDNCEYNNWWFSLCMSYKSDDIILYDGSGTVKRDYNFNRYIDDGSIHVNVDSVIKYEKSTNLICHRSKKIVAEDPRYINYDPLELRFLSLLSAIEDVTNNRKSTGIALSDTIISVDIETVFNVGKGNLITEIAACCICKGNFYIFHRIADGVKENSDEMTSKITNYREIHLLTGLIIMNNTKLNHSQSKIIEEFKKFVDYIYAIENNIMFISYGGSDEKMLNLENFGRHINLMTLYKKWLEKNEMLRDRNYGLCDVVADIFGHNFITRMHSAFEDAMLTLCIFMIINDNVQ